MVEVALVAVQVFVKVFSLFLVALEHSLCTTVLFYPVQHLVQNIDCVAWRCVVHAAVVCVCLVCKHCWSASAAVFHFRDKVFADDYECNASRSKVFLCTGKEKAKLANIKGFAEYAGRNVCYERNLSCVRDVLVVGSHDCVVKADVCIVVVAGNLFYLWDVRVVLVLGGSDNVNFNAELFCFCSGFLCPDTGFDVGSLSSVNAKVLCNHCKLC